MKVWRKTLSLVREHAKERLAEVIHTISEQLARAGQHQEAAELFLEYNDLEEVPVFEFFVLYISKI